MRRAVLGLCVSLLASVLAGCGGGGTGTTALTVFAASSLQEPFTALARDFERDHPGTEVQFSFGASSALAEQLHAGAPADVFASASTVTMDEVRRLVEDRTDFATNRIEIAVPPGNPAHVRGLADLTAPGVKVAICQADVPCGVVAAEVLDNASLTVRAVTEEVDVKAVLAKVELGEVDAGLVYVSDVRTAGDKVDGVPIPDGVNAVTTYPIARLQNAHHGGLAKAFENLVLGPTGRAALADSGFAAP